MDWDPPDVWTKMAAFLHSIAATLPQLPRAIVVVSGHWEEQAFTAQRTPQPALIYDYGGFPPHTYQIQYPAPGAPELALEVMARLQAAGLPTAGEAHRGYDHGVFIPLKLVFPAARIPIMQLSLMRDLDPARHIAAGAALAALRDDNVLVIGSGMSFHNMRHFMRGAPVVAGAPFADWLTAAVGLADLDQRAAELARWAQAPGGREAHPRAEHLLPLMVVAGAGGSDAGREIFRDTVMNAVLTAYRFG